MIRDHRGFLDPYLKKTSQWTDLPMEFRTQPGLHLREGAAYWTALNMTNRLTWILAFLWMDVPIMAQVQWSFEGDASFHGSSAYATIEKEDGGFVSGLALFTAPTEYTTDFMEFSAVGDFVTHQIPYDTSLRSVGPWIFADEDGFDLWIKPYNDAYEQNGWRHMSLNEAFEVIDETQIDIPGNPWVGLNLSRGRNGDVIWAGGGRYGNEPWGQNTLFLLERYTQDGDLVQRRFFPAGGSVTRQVVETPEGYTAVCLYMNGIGPPGFGKLLRFDHEFNYVSGFALPDANGTPLEAGQDSLPLVTGLFPLAHGGSIISGYFDVFWGTWQACLMKMDSLGNLVERINPTPSPIRSESLQTMGLRALSDTTFLWCYYESDAGGEAADRFKFAVVDTNLNILRMTTFETGYPEAYIDLLSVLPTSDGGYLVSGQVLHPPYTQGNAYVAKINGSTGVAERLGTNGITVYPNPGTSFTLQLGDRPYTGSMVQVYDPNGKCVVQERLLSDRTQVDAQGWASGLYLYRVVDQQGKAIHQGKWMRE